ASSRLASCCSSISSSMGKAQLLTHGLRERVDAEGAVQQRDPLREAGGQLDVGGGDVSHEPATLALQSVLRFGEPPHRLLRLDREHEGSLGENVADETRVQVQHPLDSEAAGDALVGERGVQEAVADDVHAALE